MKRALFFIAALGFLFGYSACERQKWEEARVLHKKHEHKAGEGDHKAGDGEKKAH